MNKVIQTIVITKLILVLTACNQARPPVGEQPESPPVSEQATDQAAPPAESRVERRKVLHGAVSANDAAAFHGVQAEIAVAPSMPHIRHVPHTTDRERYAEIVSNGVVPVGEQPVSTFSIDVDTGSYANVRRMLNEGRLPRKDAVRVEELVNYFRYDDQAPNAGDAPFHVDATLAPTPWNAHTRLLRIALKAREMPHADLPASNLVFLIDVSGSMNSADKLPLLKRSLKLLTRRLDSDDRVSLVVYAGASGVVLEPTAGDQYAKIEAALDKLGAGGSTHGSAGIKLAYAKARESFIDGGINRVILATDGDFNVGTVDQRALLDLIEHERKHGIALTALGFGRGNLNDQLMERLADHGNGNYAYIDNLLEAQKVLVEQMGGTLMTVASDVKIQVEFNPARVAEYRLIGYENRLLRREDFNNDKVDAGEIGAGHSVVALYELTLTDSAARFVEPLRYARGGAEESASSSDEYAFIKLRYKAPGEKDSELLSVPLGAASEVDALVASDDDFRFSAAVAAFAQHLRGATYLRDFGYRDILTLARGARGSDDFGYRADFVRLVSLAESLDHSTAKVAAARDSDG